MTTYIEPEQALQQVGNIPLFDVRTPAEFEESHIPGAINLPLFSNEERAEVGTLYKQHSPREALLRGLEIVGPKMRWLIEQADRHTSGKQLMVHCWRGGQRSSSVGWLLEKGGYEVQVLQGGYKAYRQYLRQQLEQQKYPFLIVGGPTGAGKTEILHALERAGEQIVDLEGLANHKGSSFGALGEASQPTVVQFENLLFRRLRGLDPERRVWVENESRAIGRVYLPQGFWKQMAAAPLFDLEVSLDSRLDRLVAQYAAFPPEQLSEAFERIGKRLGGQHLKAALKALKDSDFRTAARIALQYYDKAYRYHTENKRAGNTLILLSVGDAPPEQIAQRLIQYVETNAFSWPIIK